MRQYLEIMRDILHGGQCNMDRTGTGTWSIFGPRMEFNLSDHFPLLTTKRLHLKSIIWELLWFLQGRTDVQWLQERGVSIWDEWADEEGDLGHIYGYQWRKWPSYQVQSSHPTVVKGIMMKPFKEVGIDQIDTLIEGLLDNPSGRRHIVSAWNVSDIENMALPPCHMFFQCYVRDDVYLDLSMYQRSADWFLGVPFNIASYAILTHLLAYQIDRIPGKLIMNFGDAHIYYNHLQQAELQLSREPDEKQRPQIHINHHKSLLDYVYEDFGVEGYDPMPHIAAPISK